MPSYVAFLRAINLGAQRKVPMADLRTCLEEAGYEDVATHIQTGNVRLRTSTRSLAKVAEQLETVLGERYGFEIPAIVFTPPQLREVYDDASTFAPDRVRGDNRYVLLFKPGEAPTGEDATAINAWDAPGEAAMVNGRAVHVWIDGTSQGAQVLNVFKKPLWPGTNRNVKVLEAVVRKWL
ncbi:MAG TPA: DUF1697 domain-containing protein [Nocardioides sp.]|nr:DUF1697 domain-containing protein [uncultured Nocardioides sp.]HEX5985759.1 DUF1697 domain-containing protein [Nocardioides sp.]